MAEKTAIQADPQALWRQVDDEIVVLEPKRGRYFGLEGVGADIWVLLQKPTSVAAIVERLGKDYEVEEKVLLRDIGKFLQALKKSRLLSK